MARPKFGIMRIQRATTITVPDYNSLVFAWRLHGGPGTIAKSFIVEKPLTDAQLRRLPKDLKRMIQSPDDSLDFLERLYRLEDPRK